MSANCNKKGPLHTKDFYLKFMYKRLGYAAVNYEEIKEETDQKNPEYKHQIFLLYCNQDEDFPDQPQFQMKTGKLRQIMSSDKESRNLARA